MNPEIIITDEKNKLVRVVQPEPDRPVWFAMSAPYSRELKARELLDSKGIENFVAMHYEIVQKNGRKMRVRTPVIHNLIFVHSTKDVIQRVKFGVPYLQYRTMPVDGRNIPIVVPDWQMEQFMKLCNTMDRQLKFYQPGEIDIPKGTRVRIIGGQFDGIEGEFVRFKGSRSNRVVVDLPLVATVVTTSLSPDLVEIIDENITLK